MGIYHPTIDNLLIHNEYVTMPGYSQSRSPLFPRPKWFVNALPPFMPDIGGSKPEIWWGWGEGGGGGGGLPSTLASTSQGLWGSAVYARTLRVN